MTSSGVGIVSDNTGGNERLKTARRSAQSIHELFDQLLMGILEAESDKGIRLQGFADGAIRVEVY